MMARALRPSRPSAPKNLPTPIPMAAPMMNLEISRTPPRLMTPPIWRNCSVVPRQNSWIPMAVLAPALVNTAVVKEPMLVTSGMKVLIIAPNSMGTTIIPAGIFFRNRMIMGFFLLVFLVSLKIRPAFEIPPGGILFQNQVKYKPPKPGTCTYVHCIYTVFQASCQANVYSPTFFSNSA